MSVALLTNVSTAKEPALVQVIKYHGSFILSFMLSFLSPKEAVQLLTTLRRWDPTFVVTARLWEAALRTALNPGIQLTPETVLLHYGNLHKETNLAEFGALFRFIQGPSDDICVLLLGYESQMLEMIQSQNPGLARRFPKEQAFYFEDYSDAELFQILIQICKKLTQRSVL